MRAMALRNADGRSGGSSDVAMLYLQ